MEHELALKHVCLPVLSALMVVGNGMLIHVTVKHKQLRTVTNFFIISLALSDMLMGLLAVPLLVAAEEGVLGSNPYICLGVMSLGISQVLASCLTLMAIAIERYIAILRPLKHHALMTTTNASIIIFLCWCYSFLVGCLPLLGWNAIPKTGQTIIFRHHSNGNVQLNDSINDTLDDESLNVTNKILCRYHTVISGSFAAFMYPGHFVCLWVVMFILYGQIYMRTRNHGTLRSNLRRWSQSMVPRRHSSRRAKENWRAMRILAIIVGYFLFSWLPVVIWYGTLYRGFTVEYAKDMEPTLPYWFYNIGITLAFGNSAVNPFLYGLGNRSVRRVWLKTLGCGKCETERSTSNYRDSKDTHNEQKTISLKNNPATPGRRSNVRDNVESKYKMGIDVLQVSLDSTREDHSKGEGHGESTCARAGSETETHHFIR